MFVGRKEELKALQNAYDQDKFQFAVIYGRRRVGKTTLMNKFIEDKEVIYYAAVEENQRDNLQRFSHAVNQYQRPGINDGRSFGDFFELLDHVAALSQNKQIVLVIDEFPYLAESYPAISSILQNYIDHHFLQSKLFLVLCGSSMSFMENQVLGYKSPLYGRRTLQLKIQPFSFQETKAFFPQADKEKVLALYGITGGIPQYLAYMSGDKSVEDNIKDTFLKVGGVLFEEPANLLKQELREPANYNSIIQAIAKGASKSNKITTKTGISSGSLTKYLNNLIDLGIVSKIVPITEKQNPRTKRTIYRITDGMFRFWYLFVSNQIDLIERNFTDLAYASIERGLSGFLGQTFEQVSRDFMWENLLNNSLFPAHFTQLGTWWGTDSRLKQEVEIDLLGYNAQETSGFLGECKWRNQPVDKSVLETLLYRGSLSHYPQKYYYLFSKSGFTKECQAFAQEVGAYLIDFKEM